MTGIEKPNPNCRYGYWDCMPCINCEAYIPPMTNADRIRAMTDEELARHLLAEADLCKFCNTDRFCVGYPTGNDNRCVEAVIKWLQQPCEESPTGQKG